MNGALAWRIRRAASSCEAAIQSAESIGAATVAAVLVAGLAPIRHVGRLDVTEVLKGRPGWRWWRSCSMAEGHFVAAERGCGKTGIDPRKQMYSMGGLCCSAPRFAP